MAAAVVEEAEFAGYMTHSVEEARDAIDLHFYSGRLDVTGPRENFLAVVDIAEIGSLTFGIVGFGTDVTWRFGELGAYHVAVPTTSNGRLVSRQGSSESQYATPQTATIFDPMGDTVLDSWPEGNALAVVKIDKLALHHQLETLLGRPVRGRLVLDPELDVSSGLGRSWASLMRWCLAEKDSPPGLLQQPIVAGRLEQAALEGLLLAAGHGYREALEQPPSGMRPAAVKRVMDTVRADPAEPYDAAKLASIAQVSLRTLQEAFRKHVGMSPMAYVNEVRLRRVHLQLRASTPGTATVTSVAYEWGFAHLGRFSQSYRVRFGETPSQTLQAPG